MKTGPSLSWFHGAQTVSKARRTNLSGEWNGLVWPDDTSQVPAEIPVKFWFDASQKIIKGEMSFVSWIKNRGVIENILIGGFQNDCDLELIYAKKEDGVIGDGRFFLELSPDAKKIEGRVVGHSSDI